MALTPEVSRVDPEAEYKDRAQLARVKGFVLVAFALPNSVTLDVRRIFSDKTQGFCSTSDTML